jgi:hypothetical protein
MYLIHMDNPSCFRATLCGGTTMDTQLWLFDVNGLGVSFDDDDPACGFQSTVTGAFAGGAGDYYLAVSGWDTDALNPGALAIWADTPYDTERAPDGPGAPGPIASWSYDPFEQGPYTITLTCAPTSLLSRSNQRPGHVKGPTIDPQRDGPVVGSWESPGSLDPRAALTERSAPSAR